ncbi:MAG: hypothetical protein JXA60_01450 [Candidatus Coatesbacteria bacterium]|nr:hypothetical protein [Candidatus Coatesbacteria bacterium]
MDSKIIIIIFKLIIKNERSLEMTLDEYLESKGVRFLSARELARRKMPSQHLWHNIVPTAMLVQQIRTDLRLITGKDIRIKVISGYRPFGTANNSANHGKFFAIDFMALIYENNKYKQEFPTSELAKIVWNYFLKHGKDWKMGAGYYPKGSDKSGNCNFIHIDLFQNIKIRPGVWEEFDKWEARHQEHFEEYPITEINLFKELES